MSVQNFYADLQNHLNINLSIDPPPGQEVINVGENFNMRVRVTNTAPAAANNLNAPNITFLNVCVTVQGTRYARPVGGSRITVNLDDQTLPSNDDGSVDVRMTALEALPEVPFLPIEKIANVFVFTDVDPMALLRIIKSKPAFTDIVQT